MESNELAAAIVNGDIAEVRRLAAERPELLNQPSGRDGWTPLEWATRKGRASFEAALLRAGAAPLAEWDYRATLQELMSKISEDCTCAGWLDGIDCLLWAAIQPEPPTVDDPFGIVGGLDPELRSDFRFLSEQTGGWWTWRRFVSLEEWVPLYEAWLARQR